jgi:hypothetical protein
MTQDGIAPLTPSIQRRRRVLLALALLLTGALVADGFQHRNRAYTPPPLAFEGDSKLLAGTVIVPTLDTPVPPGKNVIWCSSFELAWNHLKSDVVKEPVRVAGAEEITKRLDASSAAEDDLPPDSCFAIAGRASEGIRDRILKEMATRFPDQPAPDIDADAVVVAYAFLKVASHFAIPFFDNDAEFNFTDAAGNRTAVHSFGIRKKDEFAHDRLRKQVEILYEKEPASTAGTGADSHETVSEFAIDPCRTTKPFQIVIAVVPAQDTLGATLKDVTSKIANWSSPHPVKFGPRDVLLIPNMAWRITHDFRELEGPDRYLLNRGFEKLWIDKAMQTVEFKLDRSGVELASESKIELKSIGTHFLFDRPFLIYMKERGAERPFFAMWVANPELLSKSQPRKPGSSRR